MKTLLEYYKNDDKKGSVYPSIQYGNISKFFIQYGTLHPTCTLFIMNELGIDDLDELSVFYYSNNDTNRNFPYDEELTYISRLTPINTYNCGPQKLVVTSIDGEKVISVYLQYNSLLPSFYLCSKDNIPSGIKSKLI